MRRLLTGIGALLLLTGCVGFRPNILSMPRLMFPGTDVPLHGYSIRPPQDPGWIILLNQPNLYGLMKRGGVDHTIGVLAKEYDVPASAATPAQFLHHVIETRLKKEAPTRHADLTSEEASDADRASCARYHMKAKDYDAKRRIGEPFLVIEVYADVCLHPRDPRHGMYFEYSERAPPGQGSDNLAESATAFFSGIRVLTVADEAYYEAQHDYEKGRYAQAFEKTKRLAEQGHPLAQAGLGYQYKTGEGVTQNYGEAVTWFRKAAEQGSSMGQFQLGYMYSEGLGVAEDDQVAIEWYRKAAEQNDIFAIYDMGSAYYFGEGVPRDYAEAMKWFQRAADFGFPPAAYMLGQLYYKGLGTPNNRKDPVHAYMWWKVAASQGHEDAQYNLNVVAREMTISQRDEAEHLIIDRFFPGVDVH
jgi:TPR repeat protein